MPPVEIVAGARTAPGGRAARHGRPAARSASGRSSSVATCPGFVWNRLQFALLRESRLARRAGGRDAGRTSTDRHATASPAAGGTSASSRRSRSAGVETWKRAAANLCRDPAAATEIPRPRRLVRERGRELAAAARGATQGLAKRPARGEEPPWLRLTDRSSSPAAPASSAATSRGRCSTGRRGRSRSTCAATRRRPASSSATRPARSPVELGGVDNWPRLFEVVKRRRPDAIVHIAAITNPVYLATNPAAGGAGQLRRSCSTHSRRRGSSTSGGS